MRRLELAERVIKLRERARLTQETAAKKAGVGVTTWSNIETGAITRPHARTLIKMARALGVTPEVIMGEALEAGSPKAPVYPQGQTPDEELDRWLEDQDAYLHAMDWHEFLALVDSSDLAELEDLHSQFRGEGDVIDISTRQRKPKEERTPLDYNLLDRTPLRDLVLTFSLITRKQKRNVSAKEAVELAGAASE